MYTLKSLNKEQSEQREINDKLNRIKGIAVMRARSRS